MASAFSGVDGFVGAIARMRSGVDAATRAAVAEAARQIQTKAQANAPHVSGALSNSIVVDGPRSTGQGYTAQVGPTAPYGRRIELGFNGTDSLGRSYNQAPEPFLRPAFDEASLADVFRKQWGGAVRGS